MNNQPKEAIRLTNKTAKNLREQARQQRNALYVTAIVLSVALCAAAVLLGIEHLIAVPVIVLLAIALDALILLLARGRYLSLTAQAICTEAAWRQLRRDTAESRRIDTAMRDLDRIKRDIAMDRGQDDEDDEDMYSPAPVNKPAQKPQPVRLHEEEEGAQNTRVVPAAQRRRRQARLQVITGDAPDNQAN